MTQKRFKDLLSVLRFDDADTRVARAATDKLAPIRELWEMLLFRLKVVYRPSEFLTVDEQLYPTRARCPIRQFMPSKPGKYGIKTE